MNGINSSTTNLVRGAANIQIASSLPDVPSESEIEDWICETLVQSGRIDAELTVRVVDEFEITALNHQYRKQNCPTDVLSFPHQLPTGIEIDLLGDVVICANIVNQMAIECGAPRQAHWARIVAHGILHLCGYNHNQPAETQQMKNAENQVLQRLGLNHPELAGLSEQ